MTKLQELELKYPPCGYVSEDLKRIARSTPFLVGLPEILNLFMYRGIRKLDMGFSSTNETGLRKMLRRYRATLRHLKLTRVDLEEGFWIGFFRKIGSRLDQLQTAEFCDIFFEADSYCSVPIVTVLTDNSLGAIAGGVRTIGFWLGEICSPRIAPKTLLQEYVLTLLERGMLDHEHVIESDTPW